MIPADTPQPREAEWIAQVQAACAALATLQHLDPNAAITDAESKAQWLLHLTTLTQTAASLSQAVDTLLGAQHQCYDQLLAAGAEQDNDLRAVLQGGPGLISTQEAGRRGGSATKARHGSAHFEALGKAGGEVTRRKGTAHYSALGKLGGAKVRDTFGPDHFVTMGKRGGAALAAKRGAAYFSDIGKLGGRKPKQRKADQPLTKQPSSGDSLAE